VSKSVEEVGRPACDLLKYHKYQNGYNGAGQYKRQWPRYANSGHPTKKYSPPHPLDTKGCCSPQNNP
jgi:hypothetical protein